MRRVVLLSVLTLGASLWAEPEYKGPIPAVEVTPRLGIGNFLGKVRAGKDVTVAYLGGSITAQGDDRTGKGGWRVKTTKWLREKYPQAKITEVHAAIGGTGSNLGVYRVGYDALRHDPDLLFVEFACNDGGDGGNPKGIWASMEGIVRQTWKKNPKTDIVFAYTITTSMTNTYSKGFRPRAAGADDMLADYYGIPSIDFGPRVWKAVAENRLMMTAGEIETAVPKDDPARDAKVKALLAKDPRILFSRDGVHPNDDGHSFYLASVQAGFAAMDDLPAVDHAARLAVPFVRDNMEQAKLVDIAPAMLSGDWAKLPCGEKTYDDLKRFGNRLGENMYVARKPGAKISFTFKGTACQIYDLLGPDCGQVWITFDGVRRPKPAARFDSYCTYYRLASLNVGGGAYGVHTVEIEVDAEQPSRQPVAFRLKDPEKELAARKFNGTSWIVGKIMLIGDLVAPKIVDFNDGWEFSLGDTNRFAAVSLPHDWAIAGPFDLTKDGGSGRLPWKGVGYYRRRLDMPAEGFADRIARGVKLVFDGVMCRSRVFVNGREAGGNDYGYIGYEAEIAPFLRPGANEILVKADTLDLSSRWYPGAGIYRRVRLMEGVRETPFIYTTDVSPASAVVHVEAPWTNFTFKVEKPRLWSFDDPHLYELCLEGVTYRYGIRSFAFKPDAGFFLNGRRVQLHGVNLHADLGILGMAYNRSAARRQLLRMKEMGVNALRTSHNPVAPETLDLCDELGIFVWDECFDKWDATSGRKDRNLEEYVDEQLERLVKRDRNHPCVFAWSIGNEIHPVSQDPAKHAAGTTRARCRRFRETVRRFDRTRPVGIGSCFSGDVLKSDDYDDLDITGWNYGGQYANYYKRFPDRPVLYTESASTVSSYGHYADRLPPDKITFDVPARQVDSMDHNSAPWSDIPDKEFERMERDTYVGGEFVWTGTDYLGEPFPYMHYLIPDILKLPKTELARSAYFGICDLLHLPKDRYYLYRSHWRPDVVTVHIAPAHWNFEGREGQERPVYVYSNGDEVELFLNGRSLGRKRKDAAVCSRDGAKDTTDPGAVALKAEKNGYYSILDRYRFRFDKTIYEPGELKAVACADGRRIGEDVVRTAGAPVRVSLEPESLQVPADGESLVFVTVTLRDAKGVPVPKRSDRVFFTLKGPGSIVSVGNADPRGAESFKNTASHCLYNGRAGLFIRRNKNGGGAPLILTARAEGVMTDGVVEFK